MKIKTSELLFLLDEVQTALDVLAQDAEEAGYPARAESAADLAMQVRKALSSLNNGGEASCQEQ